jgi:RHS repeat-associated protein
VAQAVNGRPAPKPRHLSRIAAQNNSVTITRITYRIAGQAVAVRITGDPNGNDGLHYLYTDHLGGINAIQRPNGALEQMRYYPFGRYRSGGPSPITDRGFTGQRENMGLGLYYYNARYYLPGAGRFLSADTIIPNPQNPQSLNRYAYTLNSPLNYSDPSGHRECGLDCNTPLSFTSPPRSLLPTIPPGGLSDRPDPSDKKGPGGQQAYDALINLQSQTGGWWGNLLSGREAIMILLNLLVTS